MDFDTYNRQMDNRSELKPLGCKNPDCHDYKPILELRATMKQLKCDSCGWAQAESVPYD